MIPDLYKHHLKIFQSYKLHKKTCEQKSHGRCKGISINEYNIAFSYLKLHQEWQSYHDASIYSLEDTIRMQKGEIEKYVVVLNRILGVTGRHPHTTNGMLNLIIETIKEIIE